MIEKLIKLILRLLGFPAESLLRDFGVDLSGFVDWKGETEGTKDHVGSEGLATYAYGILESTAKACRIDPDDYHDRRAFALAVYHELYGQMKRRYPEIPIDAMERKLAHALFSLFINVGSFPPSVVKELVKGDLKAAMMANLRIVTYMNRTSKIRYFSKGLAARRAKEWNMAAAATGLPKLTRVRLEGARAYPKAHYMTGDTIVYTYLSDYELSPDNSMKEVAL